jgi:hypothetical protein
MDRSKPPPSKVDDVIASFVAECVIVAFTALFIAVLTPPVKSTPPEHSDLPLT